MNGLSNEQGKQHSYRSLYISVALNLMERDANAETTFYNNGSFREALGQRRILVPEFPKILGCSLGRTTSVALYRGAIEMD